MYKKVLSVILCACMLLGCAVTASAAADTTDNVLKIVNYNVDGLPVPSFISKTGKNTVNTTKEIGKLLKAMDADIIAVQEDFEFHPILKSNLDMPYSTYPNGGTGTGDGLNIFSAYELFDTGRQAWKDAYGIFDHGSDKLTPKGIVYATVDLGNGAYVDIYDIHADAMGAKEDKAIRVKQYQQLFDFVDTHSADKAVIITGDFNSLFAEAACGEYLKERALGSGYKEAWYEIEHGGNYFTDLSWQELYGKFHNMYNCDPWGNWDAVEKVFFRDSEAVQFTAVSHEYRYLKMADGSYCSDHVAAIVELSFEIDEAKAAESLKELRGNSLDLSYLISNIAKSFYDLILNVLKELPKLISGEVKIDFMK